MSRSAPRPAPLALLALCLAPCLALGACSLFSTSINKQWVDAEVRSRSESVVYEICHLSLQRAGYPVGIGADKGKRRIETGWYVSESPFKGRGYRQRATLVYEPHEDGAFLVTCRVERETNESFRPLDPRYAEWKADDDNAVEAERILQYVRSYLARDDDFEVGPGESEG